MDQLQDFLCRRWQADESAKDFDQIEQELHRGQPALEALRDELASGG